MKKKLLCISGAIAFHFCYGQDSLATNAQSPVNTMEKKTFAENSFFQKEWVRKSTAPLIFFSASAASWGERKNIREIRNRYIPTFKVGYDNYLQYAPSAAVYVLKVAGVKGRNNIGRATLSYGASIGIMAIFVNSLKYTTKVERPDGSNNNSFPSGHTSMAFTNASFLHKEYGLVNHAYSIGGYSAAALTGLGRNLNNRHWISDVLAGAGIGILSTELGYFFINKIYKNRGDNLGILANVGGTENPSFLSLKLGTAISTTNFLEQSALSDKKEVGFETGLEGAFFFSKNWGVGGDFNFSSFPVKPLKIPVDHEPRNFDITTQSLGFLTLTIGPYYNYEITEKLQITLKATAGYSSAASGKILIKDELFNLPNNEFEVAAYKPSNSFRWNSGAAFTYKFNNELGITFYADYNQTQSTITYQFNEILKNNSQLSYDLDDTTSKEKINFISLGLKLTAFF